MHGSLPASEYSASFGTATSGSEFEPLEFSATCGSDGFAWFGQLAQKLWPRKTAATIAYLASLPERTAYALAGGTRQPMGTTVIRLLRSREGGRFLAAVMAGSNAPWWRGYQDDRKFGHRSREFVANLRGDGVQLDMFSPGWSSGSSRGS